MTVQTPIPDFAAAREAMVESQLRPQGVTDPARARGDGLDRARKFPARHTQPLAYVDRAVAIGEGRFLPAPAVLGQLLTQMTPEPGQRALVVGAGTGYSAAVLTECRARCDRGGKRCGLGRSRARTRDRGGRRTAGSRMEQGRAYDQILIDGAVEHIPERSSSSSRTAAASERR